jgi:hypothetical protein
MGEAAITINGKRLSDAEAEVVRLAVETFAVVLTEGIEAQDAGITGALNERYLKAMAGVQRLLFGRETSERRAHRTTEPAFAGCALRSSTPLSAFSGSCE